MIDILKSYRAALVDNANFLRDTNDTDSIDYIVLRTLHFTLETMASYAKYQGWDEDQLNLVANQTESITKFVNETDWGLSGYTVAAMLTDIVNNLDYVLGDLEHKQ